MKKKKFKPGQSVVVYYAGKGYRASFVGYRTAKERKGFYPECDCWCLIDNDFFKRVFDSNTEVLPYLAQPA